MSVTLVKGKLRKSTGKSAGYDLFATEAVLVPSGGRALVATGVVTEMSAGVVGIIKDRSGLAVDNGVTTFAGVIDGDYDQEWKVVVFNSGTYPLVVNAGDRIAQVLFFNHLSVTKIGSEAEIEVVDKKRTGGFGSTGK